MLSMPLTARVDSRSSRLSHQFARLFLLLLLGLLACAPGLRAAVALQRVPDGGLQPQVVVGKDGTVHLIYLKGDPGAADVYYVRKQPGQSNFSRPIRVNSQPGSAIAVGTIRGAQISLGKNDRVHVAWNGSNTAEPKPTRGVPMLYARMNEAGTGFEPQRNLMTRTGALDGGGSVAADSKGEVLVVWHAMLPDNKSGEAGRAVYVARSHDEGKTFTAEEKVTPEGTGVCGCCGLRSLIGENGHAYVLYRAANQSVNRDMTLLTSDTPDSQFRTDVLQKWQGTQCPMSSAYLLDKKDQLFACWESGSQVYFNIIGSSMRPVAVPGPEKQKHPVLASNQKGEVLIAWAEGTGWQKGGSVAWQVFGSDAKPTSERGRSPGIPAWGLAAAYAEPDGKFVVLY